MRSLKGVCIFSNSSSGPRDLAGLDLTGEPGRGTDAGSRLNEEYRDGGSTDIVRVLGGNEPPNTDARLG